MSLIKTLAKVAVGVAVAKGVSGMLNKGSSASQNSGGLGGLFGQAAQAKPSGGIEGMLGSLMGGQGSSNGLGGILESLGGASNSGGGLNGMLGQLAGGNSGGGGLGGMLGQLTGGSSGGGGLGGMLGQLAGGSSGGGGGLGGMLGGLLGGAGAAAATNSFGSMLNQAIARQDEPDDAPTADQEALAALMLSAMIQAMKADGQIDKEEQKRLLGRLGDVSDEERAFVEAEMKKDSDPKALAKAVPEGLEQQIYAMSVMGIDLDSQEEAQYLDQLASAMGLNHATINGIHEQLGVPTLYT